MDIEEIRKFRRAEPFRPFRIVLKNGRELQVKEAYSLAISAGNKVMLYSTLAGDLTTFQINDVRDASLIETSTSTGSAK